MPKPLPKVPEDPAIRAALAEQLLDCLAAAETDEELNAWLFAHTPRLVDGIAIVRMVVARCTPESPHAHLRELAGHLVNALQAQLDRLEKFDLELVERDKFGAMRRIFYQMAQNGELPPDWRTCEGNSRAVMRWVHEMFEGFADQVRAEKAEDPAARRMAMVRIYEAVETAMDRLLTLAPADREELRPIVEIFYNGLMPKKAENLGE